MREENLTIRAEAFNDSGFSEGQGIGETTRLA